MPTRVLVIDDDPTILEMYREILDLEGYVCIPHRTPLIDIDEVARIAPNLIITDWLIGATHAMTSSPPCMALIAGLHQSPTTAQIPILVCSAAGSLLHLHDEWLAEQGVVLVDKPFDIDVLLERIAALIAPNHDLHGYPQ